MPEIEFLPEDPGDAEATEELGGGPRRQYPRWLGGAVLAAVAVGAIVVALHRGDPSRPRSAATTPGRAPSVTASVPIRGIGRSFDEGDNEVVRAAAVAGDRTWLLLDGRVGVIDGTGRADSEAFIPAPPVADDTGRLTPRLVLDVAAGRLWVVDSGAPRGRVLEYDTSSMHLLSDLRALPAITAATALGGRLYLAAGTAVLEVSDGAPHALADLRRPVGALVADPRRNRLLAADLGEPTRLWAIALTLSGTVGESAQVSARVSPPVRVAVTKVSLGVVGDAIWLAGFDTGDGVLMRLDPTTLQPDQHSSLDPLLEPGAEIVAAGAGVLWLRDGGAGSELRCVDTDSGRQTQSWTVDGHVASTTGRAVIATASGARPLELDACAG